MRHLLLLVLFSAFYGSSPALEKPEKEASCHVIVFAGPFVEEEAGEAYRLPSSRLRDVCPKLEKGARTQEAKIKTTRQGQKIETDFDVVETFADRRAGRDFARGYGIADGSWLLTNFPPKCRIIRAVRLPLRKRNDRKTTPTLALLDTCLSARARERAHPMITFEEDGRQVTRIFEVLRTFTDRDEAEKYARENSVRDVEISEEYQRHVSDCRVVRVVGTPLTKKPNVPTTPKIALLDTCLNDEIPQQRPVVEVVRNGKKEFREFKIIRTFADKAGAEKYAKDNALFDVDYGR